MNAISELTKKHPTIFQVAILLFVVALGIYLFTFTPRGDDWETFHGTAWRIIEGTPIYGEKVTHAFYSNPPWVAGLLVPAALFPFEIAQAFVAVASLAVVALLSRKYELGILKLVLVLLSPPMVYTLLHGQIDALILGGVLLPQEWWFLVAISKPQVAIGLVFGVNRQRWLRAGLVTAGIVGISFILWGLWPLDVLNQPTPFVGATHNIWLGLWPFQVPVGVALVLVGIQKRDERSLIAASPFFAPYAATSSLLGPWLVAASGLESWQALIVLMSWWGVVVFRALG